MRFVYDNDDPLREDFLQISGADICIILRYITEFLNRGNDQRILGRITFQLGSKFSAVLRGLDNL